MGSPAPTSSQWPTSLAAARAPSNLAQAGAPHDCHSRAGYGVEVVLAADIQMLIGSGMPVVLAIGFVAILALRRRDRRRSDPDDD